MRPAGVVLIALFHFLSALFLVVFAISLIIGGSVLGAITGGAMTGSVDGLSIGILVGVLGGLFFGALALIAAVAGYGVWTLREWGRILSIVLAVIGLLFSFPGLLMLGLHMNLFLGTYRLFRIAIGILIIWYLMQPQIKVLFQPTTQTPVAR